MKKFIYLIVLALILGLVLTGCLLSNVGQVPTSEQSGITYLTKGWQGDPDVFTLFAGQDIPVGTVTVSNDSDNLTVTYNTTDGWVMTETHLAVVPVQRVDDKIPTPSRDEIPQTKKSNPIPGQFPYKHEKLGGVTSNEYVISLNEWDVETELYIAAHAVVVKLKAIEEEYYKTVWQIGDVEKEVTAYDDGSIKLWTGLSNYADEFNWGFPADSTTEGPSLGAEKPDFTTDPFIVGTTPTDGFPFNLKIKQGTVVNAQ